MTDEGFIPLSDLTFPVSPDLNEALRKISDHFVSDRLSSTERRDLVVVRELDEGRTYSFWHSEKPRRELFTLTLKQGNGIHRVSIRYPDSMTC